MIDTETNLDLKEGKAFYVTPFERLTADQLAKAYAYALFTFGESTESRIVLDTIRDRDGYSDNDLKEELDKLEWRNNDLEEENETLRDEIAGLNK